jgi:mRNA-degrading endonuclease HigB of HigAB toxin-antitoxin module
VVLPPRLFEFLHRGAQGLLITVGGDGWPHAAFTWIGSPEPARVRVVADEGSTTLANLTANAIAAAQVIGPDNLLYLVKGMASVSRGERKMPDGLKVVIAELAVREVKDQSWAVVSVTLLQYRWTKHAMIEMEQAVFRILTT